MLKMSKKTKIMFIEPPLSVSKAIKSPNHQFPLGLLYMAGVLEKNGFNVKILDCPLNYEQRQEINKDTDKIGLNPSQIKQEIEKFRPDIIGVSCSFTMFESDSFEVINLIKKINKKILTVVGGAHTSANPEYVLRNKNIDLAVIGEGEYTILEIAKNKEKNKSLNNINGTALISKGKFKRNKPRQQIQNLDNLEPAWHLINFEQYFSHPDNSANVMRSPSINIITSRGCPGQCVFCSIHTVWGRKWRAISAKKVVDQLEFLHKNYGIRHFRINDDNLTLDKKRIISICREIRKRKLDIKWDTPSGIAFWTLDKQVLREMKKAGYYRVTFGIESGCEKTLKYIRKNIDLKKVEELISYCHKIGLWTSSFFIIGFPYETKSEIKKTFNFIVNSQLNFPFVFLAQPYMGTQLYEDFKALGLLDRGFINQSSFIQSKYKTKYLTPEQLNNIRKKIYINFYFRKFAKYLNPWFFYREFLSKITNKEELSYIVKIMKNLVTDFLY
jgi:magnesium-protoporphyrin IX monomethyl ester (oxidative) cyclase